MNAAPPPALWQHVSSRTRGWIALQIVAVITGGLALDRTLGWPGQHLATAWTVAVFAWLVVIGRPLERRALVACTLIAGTGEAVLSLGWGIYDYQFGNLPWFVPPGHALLLTLGVLARPWVSRSAMAAVVAGSTGWAAVALWRGTDQFGAALAGLFLLCVVASRGRDLYAAMLVLALLMELYGTALGNWAWRPVVPGTGWSAANPPFAAGAFYCLLDLLVLALLRPSAPRASSDTVLPMPASLPRVLLPLIIVLGACARPAAAPAPAGASPLGTSPAPADNPDTPAKVALGAQLFYDPRLSSTGAMSCEGCHYRALGWTDTMRLSTRATGVVNARHTPTLYNVGHQTAWYWDGRATTLEGQIAAAWKSQLGANTVQVAAAVNAVPAYRAQFTAVFGDTATEGRIAQALASYVRTLNSGPSAWDRFQAGDRRALTPEQQAGWQLFIGKAGCAACHVPPRFADGQYHNIGLEAGKATPDRGRAVVTKDPKDERAFKTPTLRSVALSRPYFHDGSAATLEAAVRYMASGGGADSGKSPLLVRRELTDVEVGQLVAFLQALTSHEPAPRPRVP